MNLQLYDASGHYVSKTVCTVISPSLCAPILLGLPFLKHNDIVIDMETRTAIDKKNGFDLLNPLIPELKLKSSRTKFNYEYHANILKLRKAVLEELKTALAWRKSEMHSNDVRQLDIVMAVRVWLEQLMAQDQLNKMEAEILETYPTVFEPCPHTEELPKDVYCRIKLKDTLKTITT